MNIQELTERLYKQYFVMKSITKGDVFNALYPLGKNEGIDFVRQCTDEKKLLVMAVFSPYFEISAAVMKKAEDMNGYKERLEKELGEIGILEDVRKIVQEEKTGLREF